MRYDFTAIEHKWQAYWAEHATFRALNPGDEGFDPARPKFYVLDMFPYPSGVGLHVGHPLGYIATDIIARHKRMLGHNVLHPMGYDAFGLPAEQFAVEHGVHPRITTEKNTANMTRQLKRLGLSYDWDRCLATIDPGYYRWTQWVFLQLYHSWFDPSQQRARPIDELEQMLASERLYVGPDGELIDPPPGGQGLTGIEGPPPGARKWHELTPDQRADTLDDHRLAFTDEADVNWCPALGTVLANEEVTNDGRSERGNHPVYKRPLKQWMLRITAYCERLLADLDLVDWPESIKLMQRNWIGRSEGAAVEFALVPAKNADPDDHPGSIAVFTTRPDTLFGATYMVLAPEHPLVESLTTAEQYHAVQEYQKKSAQTAAADRASDTREKTGVFTGAHAVNPVNGERLPIWIADYVMMGYGTGAIMAVPAHDDRDFEFASQYGLTIRDVVLTEALAAVRAYALLAAAGNQPAAEGETLAALTDFVALCISQKREDYPQVWETVRMRREPSTSSSASRPPDERRGRISSIWMDTIDSLGKSDLDALLAAAREGRLAEYLGNAVTEPGICVNSTNRDICLVGKHTAEAKNAITEWLEAKYLGSRTVRYKLRDWLFSRQRYWGEPFPILHDPEGRIVPVDEADLPVRLPEMEDFKPTATDDPDAPPQPPLGRAPDDWKYIERDGVRYARELNTMPQWAGSCWYYLRFTDPHNADRFSDPQAERYWMAPPSDQPADTPGNHGGVDLYVGGAEHAVLHLLYARFWHKVLYDLGHVGTPEPFARLFNQGYIQAYAYTDDRGVYVPADQIKEQDGKLFYEGRPVTRQLGKMGKSLKNSITPDEICDQYGCDTLRLYEMYLGPLDQSKLWRTRDIVGVHRFLQRLWRNLVDEETGQTLVTDDAPHDALHRKLHHTIKRVTDAMESLAFNVAIAGLIELNNELVALDRVPRKVAENLILLLGPIAPHIAEELWQRTGHVSSLAHQRWPEHDPAMLVEDNVDYPVQINGKLKGRITVPADADNDAIEHAALNDEKVQPHLSGLRVLKVIVVKGKMVNVVAKA